MTIDLQLPKTQCIHVVYWFGLLGSPKVKPAQHTSSTAPGFWRKVANLTGRVKTCYLKWGMLIVAFFLKSTGAGFWWAWTASWHGIVTSHSWGWCPGFVKPRGPPNWTHFALRRSLAWSLMEKGVTVGSSLSGTKRGKCFLLASVVVRFEWHHRMVTSPYVIRSMVGFQGKAIVYATWILCAPTPGDNLWLTLTRVSNAFFVLHGLPKGAVIESVDQTRASQSYAKTLGTESNCSLQFGELLSVISHSRVQTLSLEWERFERRSFV